MSTNDPIPPVSKAALWTGRALSVLPSLMLVMAGVMMFMQNPTVVKDSAK